LETRHPTCFLLWPGPFSQGSCGLQPAKPTVKLPLVWGKRRGEQEAVTLHLSYLPYLSGAFLAYFFPCSTGV